MLVLFSFTFVINFLSRIKAKENEVYPIFLFIYIYLCKNSASVQMKR